MNVEDLIGTMIQGALQGGGKRSHGTRRFLGGGRGSFLNASTLLTVGGLVWGVIETMQQQSGSTAGATPAPPGGAQAAGGTPATPAAAPPPPLPGTSEASTTEAGPANGGSDAIPEGAARLVRLLVSAARADGILSDTEREVILQHARAAGAEALVAAEIDRPTPLARIVDGITDPQQRADLYVLAYGIVRADEATTGAEQIYLAQLAALLDLAPGTVERLERDAAARIEAEAAQ